jgi:hypothetical protein
MKHSRWQLFLGLLCLPLLAGPGDLLEKGWLRSTFFFQQHQADRAFDAYGSSLAWPEEHSEHQNRQYGLFLEYGASSRTTLILEGRFSERELTPNPLEQSGYEVTSFTVRRLIQGSRSGHLQMEYGVMDRQGEDPNPLALSTGGTDFLVKSSYTYSLIPQRSLVIFDLGYVFRGKDVSDDILATVTTHWAWTRVEAWLAYEVLESQDKKRASWDLKSFPLEQSTQTAQATLAWNFGKRTQLQLSYLNDLAGKNTFQRQGFGLAIQHQF